MRIPGESGEKNNTTEKTELQTPDSPPLVANEGYDEVTDYSKIDRTTIFKPGDFRLLSYEWGVTYAGMLLATEVTGDQRYAAYTIDRLKFLSDIRPWFMKLEEKQPELHHPMFSVIHPKALDDCGSLCAAMIKTQRQNPSLSLDPMITNFISYISSGQQRLTDGTLARNRPQPNTLWLDDLFMSVPALAQMGKYTGDMKYFDDAVKQVLQFSKRMFNYEKGLYIHGWAQEMEEHPQFHWARANGWALMAMVELLEVLPENHEGRAKVLDLLRRHIRGLADCQSGDGFWHQLLDRNDSYLETSATAIYALFHCTGHQPGMGRRQSLCPYGLSGLECSDHQSECRRPGRGNLCGYRNGFRSGLLLLPASQHICSPRVWTSTFSRS